MKNIDLMTTDGMAELKGSEKQVSWAKSIRFEMLNDLALSYSWAMREAKDEGQRETLSDNFGKARDNMAKIESAKWFIENRDLESAKLLGTLYHMQ